MVDKVLQRKMFRKKALEKYGGDMLPKFQEGGMTGIESLYGQPYDSRQAMLLAVAGRLLQAEQRPGEGMFAGVGRGVGKAITEDFPVIKKLSLEDRATRLKALKDLTDSDDFKLPKRVFDKEIMDFTYAPASEIAKAPTMSDGSLRYFLTSDTKDVIVRPKRDLNFLGKNIAKGERLTFTQKDFYKGVFSNKDIGTADFEFGDVELSAVDEANTVDYKTNWLPKDNEYKGKIVAASAFADLGEQGLDKIADGATGSGLVKALRNVTRNVVIEMDNAMETFNEEFAGDGRRQRKELIEVLRSGDVNRIRAFQADDGGSLFRLVDDETLRNVVEFARKDDELNALLVDLAYLKAKTREPGGRFSVTDIELAMRTIGGGTLDRDSSIRVLTQAINNTYNDAFKGFITHINSNPLFEEQYGQSEKFDVTNLKGFQQMLEHPVLKYRLQEFEPDIAKYMKFKGQTFESKDFEADYDEDAS
tara:strand:- start:1909 stop:3333 length:1425 start_codon:yes stop_codon:yes gene_type:complete